MDITASELFYLLSRRYPLAAPAQFDDSATIRYAQVWRGQGIQKGVLYVVSPQDLARVVGADAVVVVGSDEPVTGVITYTGPSSAGRIAEAFAAAIIDLQTWDIRLKDACLEGCEVEELLGIGHTVLYDLTDIADFDFARLYRTPGLPEVPMGGNIDELDEHDQEWSSDRAQRLLSLDDYAKANAELGTFFFPFEIDSARYVCGNIFLGSTHRARLLSLCPQGLPRYARTGLFKLFGHFLQYLRQTLIALWQNDARATIDSYLREELSRLAFGDGEVSMQRIGDAARQLAWDRDDTYVVFVLKLFKGPSWETLVEFKRNQLELTVPNSIAVKQDDEIVCFCNYTATADARDTPLRERVRHVAQDLACTIGLSRKLEGIDALPVGVKQSRIALEMGREANPHFWIHYFEDHVRSYLLRKTTEDMPVQHIVHPGIQRLIDYDAENETDYYETLHRYFDCEYNVAKAADEMYLHRTTFSRRISKIPEIAGFDPRDSETRLDLAISFWLLNQTTER